MIVSGSHGIEYGSDGKTFTPKDFIFAQCEAAQDTAMARGDFVVWDETDNRTQAGINQETRGLRVKHTTTAANLFVAGCLESVHAALVSPDTLATRRADNPILVQVYGLHTFAKVIHTAALAAPALLCTSTTAGAARPAVTATNADIIARVAITMAATINGTTNIPCFIKAMG